MSEQIKAERELLRRNIESPAFVNQGIWKPR